MPVPALMARGTERPELGHDPLDHGRATAIRRPSWLPRRHLALGVRPSIAPGVGFIAIGVLLGPAVSSVISDAALRELDLVASVSLAILGVFVGLGTSKVPPHLVRTATLGAAIGASVAVAVTAVGMLLLAFAWRLHLPVHPLVFALLMGLCSSASAATSTPDPEGNPLSRYLADLDDVPLVVFGTVANALLGSGDFGSVAARLMTTILAGAAVGIAGWLLFERARGPAERGVFVAGAVILLAGVGSLALIALVAGLELNFRRLRSQLRVLATLGTVIVFGTIGLLTVMLWLAWPWLPFPELGGPGRAAAAIITAALVASFSPTVTLAVIAELRSRGSLTDLIMALVVLADLALIFVFALAMQFARWAFASNGAGVGIGMQLSWEIFGSLAFGGIVGAVFALYLRLVGRELTLVLLAVCALLAVVAPVLHFELILAALAAGLVVENLAPPEGDDLRDAIERGALPVLVIFFAAAGASLQLDVLAVIGGVALALAAIRLALVRLTADVGVRLAGVAETPARHLWMGLVSQAGVTLGLATIAAEEFPGWGEDVRTLVVALTGLHVLTGPIFLKACLARAGEIRPGSPP